LSRPRGGVHHKLLMFLTWMGSFTWHRHNNNIQGTTVYCPIRWT
jgi:hypothetical protein